MLIGCAALSAVRTENKTPPPDTYGNRADLCCEAPAGRAVFLCFHRDPQSLSRAWRGVDSLCGDDRTPDDPGSVRLRPTAHISRTGTARGRHPERNRIRTQTLYQPILYQCAIKKMVSSVLWQLISGLKMKN